MYLTQKGNIIFTRYINQKATYNRKRHKGCSRKVDNIWNIISCNYAATMMVMTVMTTINKYYVHCLCLCMSTICHAFPYWKETTDMVMISVLAMTRKKNELSTTKLLRKRIVVFLNRVILFSITIVMFVIDDSLHPLHLVMIIQ